MIIDTSILIDCTEKDEILDGGISIISLLEMIRGTQSNVRKEVKHYLERAYEVYPIDNEVVLKYSEIYNGLRKEGKMIPEPDIIIGATAISRNRPLMTRDVHFERLQDYGLVLT